jgi:hypothetical protein
MDKIERDVAVDREMAALQYSYTAIKNQLDACVMPLSFTELQELHKFMRAVLSINAKPTRKPKRASKTKSSGAGLKKKEKKNKVPKVPRKPKAPKT